MNPIVLGILNLLIYFIIAISIAFPLRALVKVPEELFRKLLHFILLGSFLVLSVSFSTWYVTAIVAVAFEIVVYPILMVFERLKKYSEFTTERKAGELKTSLLLVYTMFAMSCISVFAILMARGGLPVLACVVISLLVGAVSATVELFSKDGNDTVFCPLAAMAILVPLVYLFGGMR